MNPDADAAGPWWVICLCAEWCGVCREWRTAFDEAAAAHPELRFAWVDIEDEAQAMGDVDVETFPTLMIAKASQPFFFGAVQPSGAQFVRLIASLRAGNSAGAVPAHAAPLLRRLVAHLLLK